MELYIHIYLYFAVHNFMLFMLVLLWKPWSCNLLDNRLRRNQSILAIGKTNKITKKTFSSGKMGNNKRFNILFNPMDSLISNAFSW